MFRVKASAVILRWRAYLFLGQPASSLGDQLLDSVVRRNKPYPPIREQNVAALVAMTMSLLIHDDVLRIGVQLTSSCLTATPRAPRSPIRT